VADDLNTLPARTLSSAKDLAGKVSRVSRRSLASALDRIVQSSEERIVEVPDIGPNGNSSLRFYAPNAVCRYRAATFSTKEPETLAWLDEFGQCGALYDIGANVGLYSVYFSKVHHQTVYAFEPSALNLMLLAKNVNLNGVENRVVIVTNPLTATNSIASFNLSSLDAGGAMSTFGETFGHDGKDLDLKLSYSTVGFSLDSLSDLGLLPIPPAIMKIDVDGIEHLVLAGATKVLTMPSLRSILIEVNDDFEALRDGVHDLLTAAGFHLRGKFHGDLIADGVFSSSFNQIWDRG